MDFFSASVCDLFKQLGQQYDIAAFVLFGSHATGRANPLSDVDLAFLPMRTLSADQEAALHLAVVRALKRDDIDLINLAEVPILLKFAVTRYGMFLACLDQTLLNRFVIETRREYLDTQYLRDVFATCQRQRIEAGLFGTGV